MEKLIVDKLDEVFEELKQTGDVEFEAQLKSLNNHLREIVENRQPTRDLD